MYGNRMLDPEHTTSQVTKKRSLKKKGMKWHWFVLIIWKFSVAQH